MESKASKTVEYGIFESYLRDRGLKMTNPREVVLEAFLSVEHHMSVDELFEAARKLDPSIGQATVFRTIKLLADSGLAQEACRDEGARQYEHAFRHEHHDHLVCVVCGKTIEFRSEEIERTQQSIYETWGFEPMSHLLELRGLCPDCRRKQERNLA